MRIIEVLRANWHFKLLSVIIAIVLWFYVLGAENPQDIRRVTCRVVGVNVPAGLEIIGIAPGQVDVRVRGREFAFELADFDGMRMEANLKTAEVGQQEVRLSPQGVPVGLEVLPGHTTSAVVRLDKIIERSHRVVEDQAGQPARGYVITGITVEPDEVTVRGAVSNVHRVARVVVVIDTSGINSTTEFDAEVEGRDNYDVAVTGLRFKPDQVKVTVAVKRVNTKTVPVRPQLRSPAADREVVSVDTSPPVVTITGSGELLARMNSIATVPIDISGLRRTKAYPVSLSVPDKVSVLDQASVRVTVTVRPVRTPPRRPEPPPQETPRESKPAEEGTPPPETNEETPRPPEGVEPSPSEEDVPIPPENDEVEVPIAPAEEEGGP